MTMSEKNTPYKKTQVRNYYTAETKAKIHEYIAYCLRTKGKEKSFSKACEELIEKGLSQYSELNSHNKQNDL
jgi:hypothetical protein